MVQGFERTRQTLADSQRQVDFTLLSMNALPRTRSDNLSAAFRQYKESVDQLEKQGADAQWRSLAMKEESDDHIRVWQEEMKTIKDPTIKASMESRRDAVRTNFKLVQMYADDARKAYEPFLRGNKEMVRALSVDLSPATMSSLAPAMEKVTADGETLKVRIGMMQRAMDNIANGISPIGMPE